MGVTLPKHTRFAGFNVSAIKNGLRCIMRTSSAESFMALMGAGLNGRERAILFEELLDRRLVAVSDDYSSVFDITQDGEAFLGTRAQTRTPIARARKLIDDFLDRAAAYNADPKGFLQIEQVWLFGSAMRNEETVGDIDLAYSTSRRPPYDKDYRLMQERIHQELRSVAPSSGSALLPFSGEQWLMERALFGERRHPIFAGVQHDTSNLEEIGAPCQLLFDRSRGGRVVEPVIARHPRAVAREAGALELREAPDYSPATLRPMDARWVTSYREYPEVSPILIFGNRVDADRLFSDDPSCLLVLTGEQANSDILEGWEPEALGSDGIDGCERVLLAIFDGSDGTSIVLHRSIIEDEVGVRIEARLESPELVGTINPGSGLVDPLGEVVALLLATDAQRVMRRQMDLGLIKNVSIAIESTRFNDELRSTVASDVFSALSERKVSIEPDGWSGLPLKMERFDPDGFFRPFLET